jgi:Ca-activated chloride channel homolog
VSFGTPAALLGLLLLPLLALAYVRVQQRRALAADAFAAPGVRPSVAPRQPGWRRHAPMGAFALALLVLVVAAARPQTTVAVPVERATIVLATDVSGSMLATDVRPNRLEAARAAALEFVEGLPSDVEVGVLAFNQAPTFLQSPTRDRAAVRAALRQMRSSGGTATGRALQTALRAIQGTTGPDGRRPPAAIVLLSDGASTRGPRPEAVARQARRLEVPISTVALGTDQGTITVPRPGPAPGRETRQVPPDREAMREVADASGGESFATADADELARVYERLGSRLSTEEQEREVSAAFAGAGLLLLLGGAAMSLGWFGRLV